MARVLRCRGLRAALTVTALGAATLMLGNTTALAATNTATHATMAAATRAAAPAADCSDGSCVAIFNLQGTEIGVVAVNPATGSVEFIDLNGNIIGIVEQEASGAVVCIGAGGAVVGEFAIDQANGLVVFLPV